jgi:hypothetical protein
MTILSQINFSLSSACTARCVYCPIETRGARIQQKVMPYDTAAKVIEEVADQARFGVGAVGIGENGDCFINPHCLDVLRDVRRTLPWARTIVYTNMQHVTPEVSDQIIHEHLVDEWQCNIDGSTPAGYEAVKGLSWERIWGHLTYLLTTRNAAGNPLRINVYMDTATLYLTGLTQLGLVPSRTPKKPLVEREPQADMLELCELLKPYLRRPADNVFFQQPYGWAERHQFDGKTVDYTGLCCPLLPRIRNEAFIAPDGSWYACCYDANNENVLGNVLRESVYDIATGERRRTLLTQLELRQFAAIGGPCRTVNCCQGL